jgi:DNA-binding MarR family transcriptional regulator
MGEKANTRTAEGEMTTNLILSIFRANGLLLATGDMLSAEHGLTAARWQVLGAIALAERPLTVPQIARRVGLTRQTVHTTVSRLVGDELVELRQNAEHRRSQLVELTAHGRETYAAVDRKQRTWVNELSAGLSLHDLATAEEVVQALCFRLQRAMEEGDNDER